LDNIIGCVPSVILCKNYFAPFCSKLLYPSVKNVYLISGIEGVIYHCTKIPAQLFLRHNIPPPQTRNDINAILNSDLVVANSPLTLKLLYLGYSEFKSKIYPNPIDTTKYVKYLSNVGIKEISNRPYDFMVASSILTRPEKNNHFLIGVLSNDKLKEYTKIIIGNNGEQFQNIPNSTQYELLKHYDLMDIMKKTKVLLYPSLYDSNPNTVREAIYNKCLVLISNNIGYCEFFPEYSVCETYDKMEWINKSLYLVENYNNLINEYYINIESENIMQFLSKVIKI
jgi:glycosyltransferase involved in cell wall biosynthesis